MLLQKKTSIRPTVSDSSPPRPNLSDSCDITPEYKWIRPVIRNECRGCVSSGNKDTEPASLWNHCEPLEREGITSNSRPSSKQKAWGRAVANRTETRSRDITGRNLKQDKGVFRRELGNGGALQDPGIKAVASVHERSDSRAFEVELNDKLMNTSGTLGSRGCGIKRHHKQTIIGHNEGISIIIII